jgi:hypothetical protein
MIGEIILQERKKLWPPAMLRLGRHVNTHGSAPTWIVGGQREHAIVEELPRSFEAFAAGRATCRKPQGRKPRFEALDLVSRWLRTTAIRALHHPRMLMRSPSKCTISMTVTTGSSHRATGLHSNPIASRAGNKPQIGALE